MKDDDDFIKAYHDFRSTVDFSKPGILPDADNVVGFMLMGVPRVPADGDLSEESAIAAIDQRVSILKAVFAEVNRKETEDFIDRGLKIYDQAGQMAKAMLKEASVAPELAQAPTE